MAQTESSPTLDQIVDLVAYPIDQRGSARYLVVVDAARAGLRSQGCAVVKDLIRPEAIARMNNEIESRKHTTHFSTESINPYFHTSVDPQYPDHHPVNTFIERSSGFIPGDSWDETCSIDALFRSPELRAFLADCLELPVLHCYADPLAGITANILDPGQQFTWHFDTNEFAVTILVQEADMGGEFEYYPAIRSPTDEGFDAIAALLASADTATKVEGVHSLDLEPGDLQIFRGRYSLHRVKRVAADSVPRHAAIFAFTEQPDVIGRVERTQQLFGRVLPEHTAAELIRVRSDTLID